MNSLASKIFAVLVALSLLLTACGARGSASGPTPTPDPDNPDLPPALPAGFTDLLQQKVDAGEWTEGQGLVAYLKLFAGESSDAQVGLGGGVIRAEATGIFSQATRYLENGDDPAAKAEISRLLGILNPSPARLDKFSIPAPESKGGNLLAAPVPETPTDCASFWSGGFPDTRTPAYPCFQEWNTTIGSYGYRIYYPVAYSGDASKQPFYDATKQALLDTLPVFSAYGPMKSVYFIFYTLEDEDVADAEAATYGTFNNPDTEACPVIIYPHGLADSLPVFKQMLAHELFHCYEGWNMRAQQTGPEFHDSEWWVEGAAEYFGNVVYPSTNAEFQFLPSFAELSPIKPITSMSYENFIFFQFYANVNGGPRAVLTLLSSMPTIPGRLAQQNALHAISGMDLEFEEYAQQVIDNRVIDADGAAIRVPSNYTSRNVIGSSQTYEFIVQAFTLARYRLQYQPRLKFTNTLTISGPAGHEGARRLGFPGTWGALPADLQTGCDNTAYVLYNVTTVPGGEEHKVLLAATVTGEAPCDQCLVGQWHADNNSYIHYFKSIFEHSAMEVDVNSISGALDASFDANGNAGSKYTGFTVVYTVNTTSLGGGANPMVITMVLEGVSEGTYTADGTNLIYAGSGDINVQLTGMVGGVSMDLGNTTNNYPSDPLRPATYTCDGDTLTYYPVIEDWTIEPIIFQRVPTP